MGATLNSMHRISGVPSGGEQAQLSSSNSIDFSSSRKQSSPSLKKTKIRDKKAKTEKHQRKDLSSNGMAHTSSHTPETVPNVAGEDTASASLNSGALEEKTCERVESQKRKRPDETNEDSASAANAADRPLKNEKSRRPGKRDRNKQSRIDDTTSSTTTNTEGGKCSITPVKLSSLIDFNHLLEPVRGDVWVSSSDNSSQQLSHEQPQEQTGQQQKAGTSLLSSSDQALPSVALVPSKTHKLSLREKKLVRDACEFQGIAVSKKKAARLEMPLLWPKTEHLDAPISCGDVQNLIKWLYDIGPCPNWMLTLNRSMLQSVVLLVIPGMRGDDFWSFQTANSQKWKSREPALWSKDWHSLSKIFPSAVALRTPRGQGALQNVQDALLTSSISQTQRHKQLNQSVTLDALIHPISDLPTDEAEHIAVLKPNFVETQKGTRKFDFVAMDCEMCICASGPEITRISLVDHEGRTIMDEYVVPAMPILDYNTKFSGITPEHMASATKRLEDIQRTFVDLITQDTPLIGHSVWHDLRCLKIRHTKLIDTCLHFESTRGPPYRPALRYLAQRYLARVIQNSQLGHDSVEDATACADLVRLKMRHGPQFGLRSKAQRHVFDEITRKTSNASGFDTRKFGIADTSYQGQTLISGLEPLAAAVTTAYPSCNDHEVVSYVSQAVQDGCGFVFGKMKSIDTVYREAFQQEDTTSLEQCEMAVRQNLPIAIRHVDGLLGTLWEALPANVALIVCSGHGDTRETQRWSNKKHAQRHSKFETSLEVTSEATKRATFSISDGQQLGMSISEATKGAAFFAVKPPKL